MKPDIYKYLSDDEIAGLIKYFGGYDLYVPKVPTVEMIQALGLSARYFCRTFGGETIYIAKHDLAQKQERQQAFVAQVEADTQNGMTLSCAIRKHIPQFGYSEKWAKHLIRREKIHIKCNKQLSLFDYT